MDSLGKSETPLIAASMRSANWENLKEECARLEAAGVDMLHFDVGDAHFIPDLEFGPLFVSWIRKLSILPLDVHLMIDHPEKMIPAYVKAGADTIMVHLEGEKNIHRLLQSLREFKTSKGDPLGVGIAISPGTPAFLLSEILPLVDKVNVMLVNPGFGGKLIPECVPKMKEISDMITARGLKCIIQADGAVSLDTWQAYKDAGASSLVSGYPLFSQKDYAVGVKMLKSGKKV